MNPTPCECPLAGYCPRWNRRMVGRLHELCRTRPDYRAAWEAKKAGGFVEQAARAVKAGVHWAAAGAPTRTAEETESLLAICRSCEHFDGRRCAHCGCLVQLKARMATEHCPIGRW